MYNLIRSRRERVVCQACSKEYDVTYVYYPCKLDDERGKSFYSCPYCRYVVHVWLLEDEDVETEKLDK